MWIIECGGFEVFGNAWVVYDFLHEFVWIVPSSNTFYTPEVGGKRLDNGELVFNEVPIGPQLLCKLT